MESVQVRETKQASGYGKPPWIFRGSALYQLHLVKAETARAFVPKEFRLVEAFGYTLGGFFLASYNDSPAGIFDELVVIAGTVWNPPTSCAWAARVLVNSDEACDHGRKDVGLPSQVAKFTKKIMVIPQEERSKMRSFLTMIGMDNNFHSPKNGMNIQVSETKGPVVTDICNINLARPTVPALNTYKWKGPAIKMSLPSFSGRTEYNPNLLKYSCQIDCRVRVVQPAKVSGPTVPKNDKEQCMECRELVDNRQSLCIAVMLSKPILALEFSCLKMQVQAPSVVSPVSETSLGCA